MTTSNQNNICAGQTQNLVVVSILVLWFARQLGLNEAASAVVPWSVSLKWSHLLLEWWLGVDRDIVLVPVSYTHLTLPTIPRV